MNFEIVDNFFQVIVLFCGMMGAALTAVRYRRRCFVILALAYTSFAIGTLFWVLHIWLRGDVPKVFYVPEISWLASYMFYLSLQLVRMEKIKLRFCWVSFVCGFLAVVEILRYHMLGPAILMSLFFSIVVGTLVYRTVFRLRHHTVASLVDWGILECVIMQVLLYVVSGRTSDYTRFNLYFAVDMVLSISFVALLPFQIREVKKNDLC